jgi:hypothetical protein
MKMRGEQQAAWAAVEQAIQSTAPRKVTSEDIRWFAASRMEEETADYTYSSRLNAFFYGWFPSAVTNESAADWFAGQLQEEAAAISHISEYLLSYFWEEGDGLLSQAADYGKCLCSDAV